MRLTGILFTWRKRLTILLLNDLIANYGTTNTLS
jgi:hypothetical protein